MVSRLLLSYVVVVFDMCCHYCVHYSLINRIRKSIDNHIYKTFKLKEDWVVYIVHVVPMVKYDIEFYYIFVSLEIVNIKLRSRDQSLQHEDME